MEKKLRAGIIGGTGYVGQRFATILSEHPWFEVTVLAASARSAGRTYEEAVDGRWKIDRPIPLNLRPMIVQDAADFADYSDQVDFVFCAVDMDKTAIRKLEEDIARTETPVVSNNSAHRWTDDVPVLIPEVNPEHTSLIEAQRKRLGTKNGFIVAKPNCSIQSYVPVLSPLMEFGLEWVNVATYQAISGAGKTFTDWPEMKENMIPYIGGEEEKSEKEPLRIWGRAEKDKIILAPEPTISAHCCRIGVQEGHSAAVSVKMKQVPQPEEIISRWTSWQPLPQAAGLPSAPDPFLIYFSENERPQPKLDSMAGGGMAVTVSRLRRDPIGDYKFICLSHNTVRGAAGGAVLTAELLVHQGYLQAKKQ